MALIRGAGPFSIQPFINAFRFYVGVWHFEGGMVSGGMENNQAGYGESGGRVNQRGYGESGGPIENQAGYGESGDGESGGIW
jgi:hypothetical protein